MITALINWVLNFTAGLNYFGVGILMAIESSFLPLPSEIIIPPAAYLASQGAFSLWLIILAGVIGSVIGASINYLLSLWLGRLVVYKLAANPLARFVLITPEKIARAEKYFLRNASTATFFGRLIPVARHLISIPAGFCRMPYGRFIFYTALGSAIWVSILAALGYFLGANQGLIHRYYREIYWLLLVLALLWIGWLMIKKIRSKRPVKT
jgi:membrane protein DedA with SNARE-associated domain